MINMFMCITLMLLKFTSHWLLLHDRDPNETCEPQHEWNTPLVSVIHRGFSEIGHHHGNYNSRQLNERLGSDSLQAAHIIMALLHVICKAYMVMISSGNTDQVF